MRSRPVPWTRTDSAANQTRCRRIRPDQQIAAYVSPTYFDVIEKRRTQLMTEVLSRGAVSGLGPRLLGISPRRTSSAGSRLLVWRFGDGERSVMLFGARDTNPPRPNADEHAPKLVGGMVRGLGNLESKVGMVQAFFACSAIAEQYGVAALDGVTVVMVSGDASGSGLSPALIEEEVQGHRAVLALSPSGPGGALTIARPGSANYAVDICVQGEDAAFELAEKICSITALSTAALGTSVVVTGGQTVPVLSRIPVNERLSVEVRARSVDELERVDSVLRSLRPAVGGTVIRVSGGRERVPMHIGSSAELFMLACRSARALDLPEPDGLSLDEASYANVAAELGFPTLDGLGAPRVDKISAELRVDADCLVGRTALLAKMIDTLARTGR